MGNWIAGAIAAVVAGIVIFILAAYNLDSQDRSITSTQQRAARVSQMDLVGMVEFDFRNIGSNFPDFVNEPEFAITKYDTSSATRTFQFVGQTKRGQQPDTVRYQWSKTGTLSVKRSGSYKDVDSYTVERYVNGSLAGSSSGIITRFSVSLLTSDGSPIAVANEARQIQVEIMMVSNLGASKTLGETHWESTIRPVALARRDYEDYI